MRLMREEPLSATIELSAPRTSWDQVSSSFPSGADITLKNPDGSTLATGFVFTSAFIEPRTLATTGTYTIVVNPRNADTGSVTLRLYDVPADTAGTLVINGGELVFGNTTPGQNGSFTFAGAAGQLVTVRIAGGSFTAYPCVTVKLFRQNGTTQLASTLSCSGAFNLAQQALPAGETYIISVDPGGERGQPADQRNESVTRDERPDSAPPKGP